MIVIERLKQNDLIENKIELQDVFIERVENTINDIINNYNADIVNIQYITNDDKSLTCIATLKMDKHSYNQYYGI